MKIQETITKYELQLDMVTTQHKEWKQRRCTNEHMYGQYETTIKMSKTIIEELKEIESEYRLQALTLRNERTKSEMITEDLIEQITELEEENKKYR